MGHISTIEVRYAETDQMGIAHHILLKPLAFLIQI